MTVQPPTPPKLKGGYRYQTGVETIRKIVNKIKKPAEGLVPIASRPPNDILNQPDVGDIDEPNYCEDWYFGCPYCFKFQEGDAEVQAALTDDVLRSFIFEVRHANG